MNNRIVLVFLLSLFLVINSSFAMGSYSSTMSGLLGYSCWEINTNFGFEEGDYSLWTIWGNQWITTDSYAGSFASAMTQQQNGLLTEIYYQSNSFEWNSLQLIYYSKKINHGGAGAIGSRIYNVDKGYSYMSYVRYPSTSWGIVYSPTVIVYFNEKGDALRFFLGMHQSNDPDEYLFDNVYVCDWRRPPIVEEQHIDWGIIYTHGVPTGVSIDVNPYLASAGWDSNTGHWDLSNWELYLDGNFITDRDLQQGQLSYSITGLSEKQYYFEVVFFDNALNHRVSQKYFFTIDQTPPEVNWVYPEPYGWLKGGTVYDLIVTCHDNVACSEVAFWDRTKSPNELIGTRYGSGTISIPWTTPTTSYTDNYLLEAIGSDTSDNQASELIGVRIDADKPSLTITDDITNNAEYETNETLTLSVVSIDDESGMSYVRFKNQNNNLNVYDYNAPYTTSWSLSTAPLGNNLITYEACDNVGNCETSHKTIYVTEVVDMYSAPTGFYTSYNDTSCDEIYLYWNDISGMNFTIERESGSGYQYLWSSDDGEGTYTDNDVSAGIFYLYRLMYDDKDGKDSTWVYAEQLIPSDCGVTPENPPLLPSDTSLEVMTCEWTKFLWTAGTYATSYTVRIQRAGSEYIIGDVNELYFDDEDVLEGYTSTYQVKSVNEHGESSWTSPISYFTEVGCSSEGTVGDYCVSNNDCLYDLMCILDATHPFYRTCQESHDFCVPEQKVCIEGQRDKVFVCDSLGKEYVVYTSCSDKNTCRSTGKSAECTPDYAQYSMGEIVKEMDQGIRGFFSYMLVPAYEMWLYMIIAIFLIMLFSIIIYIVKITSELKY